MVGGQLFILSSMTFCEFTLGKKSLFNAFIFYSFIVSQEEKIHQLLIFLCRDYWIYILRFLILSFAILLVMILEYRNTIYIGN